MPVARATEAFFSDTRPGRFGHVGAGTTTSLVSLQKGTHVIPLLLILLLLALVLGGFFVFTLKVAVIVAIVLLILAAFGGFGYRGRRTV